MRIWRSDLGSEQEPDVALEGEDAITSIATSVSNHLCHSLPPAPDTTGLQETVLAIGKS